MNSSIPMRSWFRRRSRRPRLRDTACTATHGSAARRGVRSARGGVAQDESVFRGHARGDAKRCGAGARLRGDLRPRRGDLRAGDGASRRTRCCGARPPRRILTLARHQARNGQIPKFVDTERDEADFWYLGCIDATLWWLLAVALLDRQQPEGRLAQRLARSIERAIVWLSCQEHQRFHLLQQNEASDWADIMPRSGFVLYTNALWYAVKRLYRPASRRRDAPQFQSTVPPCRRRAARVPAGAAARPLRAAPRTAARPLPQLRQLLVPRRRRRCVRQRARDPARGSPTRRRRIAASVR